MHPVGMDFGLKVFLTLSDGSEIESPQFLREGQVEIARLNRALSRKRKGSHHWRAARRRLAHAHRRIAWKRRDWFFKTAHDLCDVFDFIGIEDLCLKGMQKLWGRKVSDLAFGEFAQILRHVCHWRGVVLEQAQPRVEIGATQNGAEVTCYVQDNGVGLDRRDHEKVFELFERSDQHIEGTGVGLALVRRIVEVHGGRTWVESEGQGKGSTFYFTLPSQSLSAITELLRGVLDA